MRVALFGAVVLLIAGLAQAGSVQVSFDHPERFSDAGTGRDAERVLSVITQHLQSLGQVKLPAEQTLSVTVTDIDLAGEIWPWRGRFGDVRVMGRQVDWPRIALRYTLSEGDRVLAQGDERVADLAYLMRPVRHRFMDPLPYEQRMLDEWFARRFDPKTAH